MKKMVFLIFFTLVAQATPCTFYLTNNSESAIWVTKLTQPDGGSQVKPTDAFFQEGTLLEKNQRKTVQPQYIYVQEGEVFKKKYVLTPPFNNCPPANAVIQFSNLIDGTAGLKVTDMTPSMY